MKTDVTIPGAPAARRAAAIFDVHVIAGSFLPTPQTRRR
jgi:hypothetical protein